MGVDGFGAGVEMEVGAAVGVEGVGVGVGEGVECVTLLKALLAVSDDKTVREMFGTVRPTDVSVVMMVGDMMCMECGPRGN